MSKKKNTGTNKRKKEEPEVGVWRPVFDTQEELDEEFRKFREAVAPDIKLFAEARAESERMLFLDQFLDSFE